ncbi:beta-N-acetylhexosaminidase [Candidatus Burkholderia verschuerenii]|uniref:beta-N-acetylhexosaminidase n=1 Tax=Candidatus Burkholderia verschuerenii TaxID=242163 RepID=UPI0009F82D87|nr:beta-N-acetylhexosaminidase [Candidatus Burkholderia verschuerenii]
MFDVAGTTLTDADIDRLTYPMTGGIILFARHFQDRAQLVALTDAIRAVRGGYSDRSGSRRRTRAAFPHRWFHRAARARQARRAVGQGRAHRDQGKVATAFGFVLASELRACGIDMSFTPVLDLNYGQSQVIGDRAFHSDPRVVAMLAKSLNHGLAGMANCGKHFPGHGFASADSHVALPTDDRALDEILNADVKPYDWLGMSLSSVIPAHVIYTRIDDKPAGFSRIWLQDILRGRLGFTGAIFSDDLSMEAARAGGTLTEAATAALTAGCDMVLVCNRPEEAGKVLEQLRYTPTKASEQRIRQMRPRGKALRWSKLQNQAEYLAARELIKAKLG